MSFGALAARFRASAPLLAVFVWQVAGSLRLKNTAFQDEALYLYAGREITNHVVDGAPLLDHFERYFSGVPSLYPVLAHALDSWGGLAAARLLSLACTLIATMFVYLTTARLFDRRAATVAAVFFGSACPILFIGHLATYDALCVMLLAAATYLAVRAARGKSMWLVLSVGPVLVLAAAVKYAGILYAPSVFALLGFEAHRHGGRRTVFFRVAAAIVGMIFAFAIAFQLIGVDATTGLAFSTTNRTAIVNASAQTLLLKSAIFIGPLVVLGIVAVLMRPHRRRPLLIMLLLTGLLAPAYHVYKGEEVSLHKHVGFGLLFLAPLAGLGVSRVLRDRRLGAPGTRLALVSSLCVAVAGTGLAQSNNLYRQWLPSDAMVDALRTQIHPQSSRLLVEDVEVARYYLADLSSPWQWTGLDFFEYRDAAGNYLTGAPAYRSAIKAGYFDLVALRYAPRAVSATDIDQDLRSGGGYTFLGTVPYGSPDSGVKYFLWRRGA